MSPSRSFPRPSPRTRSSKPSTRRSRCSWSSPRASRCRTPRTRGPTTSRRATRPGSSAQLPRHHHPGRGARRHHPGEHRRYGPVGLVSKSGTLTYQMMFELREYGFSTAIGIGGDPVIGTTHIDAIEAFEKDPETKVIVMIGEIGGDARSVPPTTSRPTSPSRSSAMWPASPLPRARPWATPAPSSPVPRARPRPRRTHSRLQG